MSASPEQLETYASIEWATPYLTSPNWVVGPRKRAFLEPEDTNIFARDTICGQNGIQQWLELYEKPTTGVHVDKAIALCKLGPALNGMPGIAHGGAVTTILDESMVFVLFANSILAGECDLTRPGKNPARVLAGNFLTAGMNVKFLRPVFCPGLVGVEVQVVERTERKMVLKAIMKDGKGRPAAEVEGKFLRPGGSTKL